VLFGEKRTRFESAKLHIVGPVSQTVHRIAGEQTLATLRANPAVYSFS